MFFVVVIPIVVLILALVSAQGQNAADDGAALFKAKCAICHRQDGASKTPTGQRFNFHELNAADVQKQSDSDLSHAIGQGKGKMPVFGKTLSEDQKQLLVVHNRGFAGSNRLERRPWQPVTGG